MLGCLCFAHLWSAAGVLAQAADAPSREPNDGHAVGHGEREFIQPVATALPRPGPCSPELQAAVRLGGTIYDGRHPDRSLAILGTPSTRKMAVYRCGSRWGYIEILAVRPRAVLLSTESDPPCWLQMTRPNTPTPPPARAGAPAPTKHRSRIAFSSDELEQSIRMIQPGVYRVERALLERAFKRATEIARTTRTRTIQAHGSVVGLSLTRIPSGGLFERLGMKRGDVLKTVNGFQIGSLDGMLKARTQLGSAPRLSLAFVRDGKPMTFEYRIR
jgi:hypothetical protein